MISILMPIYNGIEFINTQSPSLCTYIKIKCIFFA